ncbi:hypothetical protein HK097_002271, partial [Rhizophlyctis rosea]
GGDEDGDGPARDSLEALVEAGVNLEPSTFGPVSRVVIETKKVAPRHLDWLARIEKGLLETAMNPSPPDVERRKWSRVRWVAAFQRYVLNDVEFKELAPLDVDPTARLPGNGGFAFGNGIGNVSPSLATPPPSPRPAITKSFFSTITETIGFVDPITSAHADLRRFHSCVAQLVAILETPRPSSTPRGMMPSASAQQAVSVLEQAVKEGGPFTKWLREIDAKPEEKVGWHGSPESWDEITFTSITLPLAEVIPHHLALLERECTRIVKPSDRYKRRLILNQQLWEREMIWKESVGPVLGHYREILWPAIRAGSCRLKPPWGTLTNKLRREHDPSGLNLLRRTKLEDPEKVLKREVVEEVVEGWLSWVKLIDNRGELGLSLLRWHL